MLDAYGTGPCTPPDVTTNKAFVICLYEHPTSDSIWRAFVDDSPLDEAFLAAAFELFRERGMRLAAYAGGYQYGSPIFDMNALFASKTVAGKAAPNEPFYSAYAALAAAQDTN